MEMDSLIPLTIPWVPTQLPVTSLETELEGDAEQGWNREEVELTHQGAS